MDLFILYILCEYWFHETTLNEQERQHINFEVALLSQPLFYFCLKKENGWLFFIRVNGKIKR